MFTGIISAIGRVQETGPARLGIESSSVAARLAIGGSVALNGVCLTVVELAGSVFYGDVVPETLRRTNLGSLSVGAEVNLELPVTLDQPLDGHLVQGHVDRAAEIREVTEVETGRELHIELPRSLMAFVAEKGSIAVDGASLTVTGVDDRAGTFSVSLIPHTLEMTVAHSYRAGTLVNLEVDLVARYLQRLVRPSTGSGI